MIHVAVSVTGCGAAKRTCSCGVAGCNSMPLRHGTTCVRCPCYAGAAEQSLRASIRLIPQHRTPTGSGECSSAASSPSSAAGGLAEALGGTMGRGEASAMT